MKMHPIDLGLAKSGGGYSRIKTFLIWKPYEEWESGYSDFDISDYFSLNSRFYPVF
jgi:hypothetical protein